MKTTTIKGFGVLLVAIVIVFGGFVLWNTYQVGQKAGTSMTIPTPTMDPSSPEYAFRTGIEDFYTADYTTGYDAWKKQLCSIMDDVGCAAVEPLFKPYYWDVVEKSKQRVKCVTLSAEKLEENSTNTDLKQQAWRAHSVIANLGTDENQSVDLYGVISYNSAKKIWQFQRIVFNTELGKYEPTPAPIK